jgi:hypothetical protein
MSYDMVILKWGPLYKACSKFVRICAMSVSLCLYIGLESWTCLKHAVTILR